MNTEIGEMPDSFIEVISTTEGKGKGSKKIIIPHKLCQLGDYKEGDTIKVWIKKTHKK
jgi:CO/xanthine dehydrogenase Mo-binding subunit